MLVYPSMIAEAARAAGMKVPDEPDTGSWDPNDYPHFYVFCGVQLYRPIAWGEHWENAKVVAAVRESDLRVITLEELIGRGLRYQSYIGSWYETCVLQSGERGL
jgi:hypothetical protein